MSRPHPALSRDEFTAKYFPQFLREPCQGLTFGGIRTNKRGRGIETKACHREAVRTKREKTLAAAYENYLATHDAAFPQSFAEPEFSAALAKNEGRFTARREALRESERLSGDDMLTTINPVPNP